MKYERADDVHTFLKSVGQKLDISHDFSRILCVRSTGSQSRYTIARCHALPKIMQYALNTQAYYVIEIITEKFDRLSKEEQIKTLLHELLHIPKSFGGGFRQHDFVCAKNVNKLYEQLLRLN